MSESLSLVSKNESVSLYQNKNFKSDLVNVFVASTPGTRAITNDPFVYGVEYTNLLSRSCQDILRVGHSYFQDLLSSSCNERNTTVLNILRGGLNFGLREAIAEALSWNSHSAAFISAQRARNAADPEEWHITESNYQKVYLPKNACIVFGDVVATGTSLEFALTEMLSIAKKQNHTISSFIFFTIGGPRSEQIIEAISKKAREIFPSFVGAIVIYLEGCFSVAVTETPVSIKYTGTDLLRRDSILSPEFLKSQLESPAYPLERCTIYDAGSRSFWVPEYFEDVLDYWQKTALLSKEKTYTSLIEERFPEYAAYASKNNISLDAISLTEICEKQIKRIEAILES